jgi:DNA-binding HxlR family transcriptional regulator
MDHGCTVYRTMEYLSKRWAVLILHELSKGEEWKRFSDIKKKMPDITPKVLTERLRELTEEGLIENRVDASSVPVKSEYRLTPASWELMDIVHDLKMWALKWKIDNPACAGQSCRICTL